MALSRPPEARLVQIYEDCEVDYGVVNVSRTAGDTVEWISTCNSTFSIDFDGSPFQQAHFDVPAGGNCVSSGPLNSESRAPYAEYRYKIKNLTHPEYKSDPGVDVRK